jgi:uncharacterized membrane protein
VNHFLFLCSLALLALALPLALGWVGPNPWYGLKPRRTTEDDALWYQVNRHAGRLQCLVAVVGGLLAFASGALSRHRPGLDMALFLGVFLVALIISGAYAFLAV